MLDQRTFVDPHVGQQCLEDRQGDRGQGNSLIFTLEHDHDRATVVRKDFKTILQQKVIHNQ